MDIEDFREQPQKGDLIVFSGRIQARIVADCNESVISLEDYPEKPLEVISLGNDGLMDKLLLHIPLSVLMARLADMSKFLTPGRRIQARLRLLPVDQGCHWVILQEYFEGEWDVSTSDGVLIYPNEDDNSLLKMAQDLIKEVESNFERI